VIHVDPGGVARVDIDDKAGTRLQTLTLAEILVRPDMITVDDFDFDGREDLAIEVNQEGPYGAPTFGIYLQNANDRFERSDALSELTQSGYGLFRADAARGLLITWNKYGCCLHETQEYELHAGKPVVVHRLVEDTESDDAWTIRTEETLVNGKWAKRVTRTPK
jgi:hypothetical protein